MPGRQKTLPGGSIRVIPYGKSAGNTWRDRVESYLRNRVEEGLRVTASATPDTNVSVSAGAIRIDNTYTWVTAGTVACGGADSTNPRIDLIEADATGIYFKLGTAAATAYAPDPTNNRIVLAEITRAASDNAIGAADINNDARPKLGGL